MTTLDEKIQVSKDTLRARIGELEWLLEPEVIGNIYENKDLLK